MRVRDRVAATVLIGTVLLGVAAWELVGPWVAIVVLVTGVLAAAVVYRLRPPALGLRESVSQDDPKAIRPERP